MSAPARSCRRRSSRRGRTSASSSSRATAAARTGSGPARPARTTGSGRSAGRCRRSSCAIADDGEVLFRGPTLFKGYWRDPEATARAIDPDGWYHTGDIGHLDPGGRLVLSGRTKDRIVLPNGFKVYPEDIENALRVAGIRDAIVVETAPGRIEAVVLPRPRRRRRWRTTRRRAEPIVDAAVRAANAALGPQQRIAGWRFWPEDDFPRTHTLKIRRDPIRAGRAAGRDGTAGDGSRPATVSSGR